MMRQDKKAGIFRYKVSCPGFSPVQVNAVDRQGATVEAANVWNVSWQEVAGSCGVTFMGRADKPRCRRCFKEFGEPGDAAAFCPACERAIEQYRREAKRFLTVRRRPGYED